MIWSERGMCRCRYVDRGPLLYILSAAQQECLAMTNPHHPLCEIEDRRERTRWNRVASRVEVTPGHRSHVIPPSHKHWLRHQGFALGHRPSQYQVRVASTCSPRFISNCCIFPLSKKQAQNRLYCWTGGRGRIGED
jgi:hypothetical protein